MNGSEILHLIRRDLQHAVARRGRPPNPSANGRLAMVSDERHAKGYPPGTDDLWPQAPRWFFRFGWVGSHTPFR